MAPTSSRPLVLLGPPRAESVPRSVRSSGLSPWSLPVRNAWRRSSGAPQNPAYPNQDHRADERDDDPADETSSCADSEPREDPSPKDSAQNPQDDVSDHAVAPAFHDDSGKPASDQSDDEPIQQTVH